MQETKPRSWLQRLKDESWEAELLISAASIFAIFNIFTLIHGLVDFFIDQLPPSQYFYGYMISFGGYLAFGILGAFFVIHFFLRAYWIGLAGLNSVFSDYSVEDSAYSEIYTKKMSDALPKLPATINALDEVCSVIFSAAFGLLIMYAYTSIVSAIALLLYNVSIQYGFSSIVYYVFAALGLLMAASMVFAFYANLKVNKGNDRMQVLFFHSAMWSNKILMGPFYRYVLQITIIFGSNFKRKKSIAYSVMAMVAIGFVFAMVQMFQSNVIYLLREEPRFDTTRHYSEHYRTNNSYQSFILAPEIQSEIISNSALRLFIPIFNYETSQLRKTCPAFNQGTLDTESLERQERWIKNLECYASGIDVLMDDNTISPDFVKSDHPITGQFGLIAFIDLTELARGTHELSVVKTTSDVDVRRSLIPFYYSPE